MNLNTNSCINTGVSKHTIHSDQKQNITIYIVIQSNKQKKLKLTIE